MRVGIDYRVAAAHAPGIGRYVRELTRALIALSDPELGLSLVDVGREPDSVPESAWGWNRETPRVKRLRLAVPRRTALAAGALGLSVERFTGDLDVFHHAKAPFLPIERATQTIAVGDLPNDPDARARLSRAAARCARVFVFSESARAIVARELELPLERLVAVPVGADHWAREIRDPESLPIVDPPRILVLGAQTSRREPMRWLRAIETLARDGLDFEVFVAGRREAGDREFLAAVAASPIHARIRFEAPGEDELPAIVAQSTVMIHLDRDALTPVTALEARAAGCAVIVSDIPVFREVLADDARYVGDDRSLAESLFAAISRAKNEGLRMDRRAIASAFTWERCARATLDVWRTLE